MSTPAMTAAEEEYVVRVVQYALENLATLGDEWFVHDKAHLVHNIRREGLAEGLTFVKDYYSNRLPPYIGFVLSIPLGNRKLEYTLWVVDPDQNVARNRRATKGALEHLRDTRNLKSVQVSAADY